MATKEWDIKEWSKSKKDGSKKFDFQEEKVLEELHFNIHQRCNVTIMPSTIEKEDDVDKRKNIMKNFKLNEDVIP